MIIAEKQDEVEVRYIFIRRFKFNNPHESEILAGHPHESRIYRSVFNKNTKHHRLILPDGVIMGFDTLVGNQAGADFEMIDITINNILDYDIREEDLDIFLKPNSDIFYQPMQNLQEAMAQQEQDEVDFSSRAADIVLRLYEASPMKGEILIQLAGELLESEMVIDSSTFLKYHKSGLSLNLASALKAIEVYSGNDRKTNEDTEDLIEAMVAITTEIERNITSK